MSGDGSGSRPRPDRGGPGAYGEQVPIRRRRGSKIVGSTVSILGGDRPADDSRSELEIFADFFHQDFDLLNEDPYDVARAHFSGISKARRAALKKELMALLKFRKSRKALMNEWSRLGAEYWQKGLDLRTALNDFVDML